MQYRKNRGGQIALLVLAIFLASLAIPGARSQEPISSVTIDKSGLSKKLSNANKNLNFSNSIVTDKSPLVVRVLDPSNAQAENAARNNYSVEKESSDWWLVCATVGLVIVGLLQLVLFFWQLWLIRESLRDAKTAADAAKDGAKAAKDAAEATGNVATVLENNAQKQIRAYLSVVIGTATYQDSRLLFEAKPVLTNNGHTPAHKISYWAKADILPWPLPPDFNFLHSGQPQDDAAVLSPGQSFILNAIVSGRVLDDEIENVKLGVGTPPKRLCVWGQVTYRDIFGIKHFTNFCHGNIWMMKVDGKYGVFGHYAHKHNDAN